MKSILNGSLLIAIAAILCLSPVVSAGTMDELPWFGNTGATNMPVKSGDHMGYWWWPTEPESNVDDSEVWGNRGVIFNMFTPPSPPPPTAPAKLVDAPAVDRSVPVFNHVLFDFDKAIVKAQGITEIKKVAAQLKVHPDDSILVEGHTCDLNSSGDPQYNQKLGQRRADAVAKVLTDNGIDASRISTASKGESSPAIPNSSDDNRKKNRRVMLKFQIAD